MEVIKKPDLVVGGISPSAQNLVPRSEADSHVTSHLCTAKGHSSFGLGIATTACPERSMTSLVILSPDGCEEDYKGSTIENTISEKSQLDMSRIKNNC